jgi:hypothetical protein
MTHLKRFTFISTSSPTWAIKKPRRQWQTTLHKQKDCQKSTTLHISPDLKLVFTNSCSFPWDNPPWLQQQGSSSDSLLRCRHVSKMLWHSCPIGIHKPVLLPLGRPTLAAAAEFFLRSKDIKVLCCCVGVGKMIGHSCLLVCSIHVCAFVYFRIICVWCSVHACDLCVYVCACVQVYACNLCVYVYVCARVHVHACRYRRDCVCMQYKPQQSLSISKHGPAF